jgi:DNA-directed RNA polymerase specialized sigma24 family protein
MTSAVQIQLEGPNWGDLVERIRGHESSALEEFYRIFSKGMRYYLQRRLGPQDLDDRVHDCFLLVIQAVRRGGLSHPEGLMGLSRVIVKRRIAKCIGVIIQQRNREVELSPCIPDLLENPETAAIISDERDLAVLVLSTMPSHYAEILTRFYFQNQTRSQIRLEMKLSDTQFRLLKSRAKAMLAGRLSRSEGRRLRQASRDSQSTGGWAGRNLRNCFDRAQPSIEIPSPPAPAP